MSDQQTSQSPGLLANILAVAGFIILIVIIVWGAYHLLRLTGSGISSLFSNFRDDQDAITVTVPETPIQSGTMFDLSWEYAPKETGTFAFLYQCKSGFRFDITTPDDTKLSIPCGSAFTVGDAKKLSVTPVLSGTSTIEVPISVVFMPSATSSSERPQGTAAVTITAREGSVATAPEAPSTGEPQTSSTPAAAGVPDLSVRIIAVGVIDPISGVFLNRYPMHPDEIAAVKFDIANNGSTASGAYYFAANLPLSPAHLYTSPAQASLMPGSHVENTLRFKPVQAGGGTITISVDSSYVVRESNEGNNIASQFIAAPVWTGYYPQYVY